MIIYDWMNLCDLEVVIRQAALKILHGALESEWDVFGSKEPSKKNECFRQKCVNEDLQQLKDCLVALALVLERACLQDEAEDDDARS